MSLSDYISSFRDAWRDPKNRFDMIDAARAVLIVAVTLVGSIPAIRMLLGLRPSEVLHGGH